MWFFLSWGRILELRRGIQASCSTGPGKSSFHSNCELELGIALETLQGQIDLIYACVQDLVFHYWANRDLRVAFSTHPESQASS